LWLPHNASFRLKASGLSSGRVVSEIAMKKLSLAALLFCVTPSLAQDRVVAFAAALAPEQAFEVCFMDDAVAAASCAIAKCRGASGGSDECVVTSACGRGWSGAMGVTTGEVHWTETVCGAPNEAAVVAALSAFCKGQLPHAQQCFLASVWDDRGTEKKIERQLDPKTLK
jgi:hypothetical protein